MKCGVTTYIWTAEFTEAHVGVLPRIKAHGFDGVEVSLFRPATFAARVIRDACRTNGLECTVTSAFTPGLSLIAEDVAVRARSLQHLRDAIEATAEAGSTMLAGPLYCPVGELPGRRRTDDEWRRAVEGYQSVADTLDACGVTLAIEPLNRFETYFLNTAADAAALCDAVAHPSVGVLFDTFHANIEEKSIAEGLRRVGRHVKHIHTCENDRGTPGSGHVEWDDVFAAIRAIGYDGWLVIESFGFALGDLSAAAAIWRDIEPSPESIAFDGIRFLRRQIASRS
ncbi:MAG: sugar phosphate isomerase/epimerase [Acidobacteria bacterium]|nr:sugar phosphate isomerase/epimerase [Acidobacteriota bacterium]